MKYINLNELLTWYKSDNIILFTANYPNCFYYDPTKYSYSDNLLEDVMIFRVESNYPFTYRLKGIKMKQFYEQNNL